MRRYQSRPGLTTPGHSEKPYLRSPLADVLRVPDRVSPRLVESPRLRVRRRSLSSPLDVRLDGVMERLLREGPTRGPLLGTLRVKIACCQKHHSQGVYEITCEIGSRVWLSRRVSPAPTWRPGLGMAAKLGMNFPVLMFPPPGPRKFPGVWRPAEIESVIKFDL